jgi:predicted secreted Zn-dependent protease
VTSLTVTNYVDPASSWAVPSRTSAEALHHEQLHFDLHEVYRRLLENTLRPMSCQASTDSASLKALNGLLNSTSAAILGRAESAQLAFDSETAHGTDLRTQAVWEDRIADWLAHPAAAP